VKKIWQNNESYDMQKHRKHAYKGGSCRALHISSKTGPPSDTTKCSTLGGVLCNGHGSNRSYLGKLKQKQVQYQAKCGGSGKEVTIGDQRELSKMLRYLLEEEVAVELSASVFENSDSAASAV